MSRDAAREDLDTGTGTTTTLWSTALAGVWVGGLLGPFAFGWFVFRFLEAPLSGLAAAVLGPCIVFTVWYKRIQPGDSQVALITVGAKKEVVQNPTIRFLPFYGSFTTCSYISVAKVHQDILVSNARFPDGSEFDIAVGLSWTPDVANLATYEKNREQEGVGKMLAELIQARLKDWAGNQGPKGWYEARKAYREAAAVLAEAITRLSRTQDLVERLQRGDGAEPIPQYGIALNRLTITDIAPAGDFAKKFSMQLVEQWERDQSRPQPKPKSIEEEIEDAVKRDLVGVETIVGIEQACKKLKERHPPEWHSIIDRECRKLVERRREQHL